MRILYVALLITTACGGSSKDSARNSVPLKGPAGESCAMETSTIPSNDVFRRTIVCHQSSDMVGEITLPAPRPDCSRDATDMRCLADQSAWDATLEETIGQCMVCLTGYVPYGTLSYCTADCDSAAADCYRNGGTTSCDTASSTCATQCRQQEAARARGQT